MRALLALALLAAPPPSPPSIERPATGTTGLETTELVADVGHGPAALLWADRSWPLAVDRHGRVAVWLPLFPGANPIGVARGGERAWVDLVGRAQGPDLVVVAGWPAAGARLDLRVVDPSGEAIDSSNRSARSGALRLRDDPEAPGPHVFLLRRATPGEYRVSIECGRLPPGLQLSVQALAILFPGTEREERIDLGGSVGRCDESTQLGSVNLGFGLSSGKAKPIQ